MKVSFETSSRIANASLVAAAAVVLLHVGISGTTSAAAFPARLFLRDFARFAVPFFFLVSGFLLAGHADESGWWRRETVKRLKSLLVPYVAWSALFGLYLLVGVALPELKRTHAFDFVSWWNGKDLLLFGLDPRQTPLMLPLWYLRTLLILVLASRLLVGVLRRLGVWSLVVFGSLYLGYAIAVDWMPELTTGDVFAMMRATLSPEAFFYFTLGLWFRLRGLTPPVRAAAPILCVTAALLVTRQLVGPWLPFPFVIPFAIYGIWCAVPATPWPKALTALSFPLYLVHWFFIHVLSRTCPELGSTPVTFPLVFGAVMAASILLTLVLRRLAPRASGLLFGGR